MIDIHKDNQSTNDPNPLPGIQDNDKNEQFFETYSLNETELKEAGGKSLDFTLTTLNQLKKQFLVLLKNIFIKLFCWNVSLPFKHFLKFIFKHALTAHYLSNTAYDTRTSSTIVNKVYK